EDYEESGRNDVSEATRRLMRKVTEARANYFMERTTKPVDSVSGVKVREQTLVISATVPMKGHVPTEAEVMAVKELSEGLQASLDSCGLAPVPVTNDLYKEIFVSVLNQGENASWRRDPIMRAESDRSEEHTSELQSREN